MEGVGEAQLEQGPGHYPGTSLPGEAGNVAIAGHRTTYAHPFYNLDALSPGDVIYILTAQGLFQYTVNGSQIVAPTNVSVLNTVPGKSTLTLTTCNPRYSAAQRLVVTANLDARTAPPLSTVTSTTRPKVTQLAGESTSSLGGGSSPWTSVIVWGLVTVALIVAAYVLWRWALPTSPAGGRRRGRRSTVLAVSAHVLRARQLGPTGKLLKRLGRSLYRRHLLGRWRLHNRHFTRYGVGRWLRIVALMAPPHDVAYGEQDHLGKHDRRKQQSNRPDRHRHLEGGALAVSGEDLSVQIHVPDRERRDRHGHLIGLGLTGSDRSQVRIENRRRIQVSDQVKGRGRRRSRVRENEIESPGSRKAEPCRDGGRAGQLALCDDEVTQRDRRR